MEETAGVTPEQTQTILETVQATGSNDEILDKLTTLLGDHETAGKGVASLRRLCAAFAAADISTERLRIDVSIARGLDYYTGTVYETFLTDLPGIGSICSGGRYDNLAGLYTKQHLPGVGASLGLDRLMAAMEKLDLLDSQSGTAVPVFVVCFADESFGRYIALSRRLRQAGIGVEFYPEAKGIGKQLKYADRRGFRFAVIGGPDELEKGIWQVKDLREGASCEVADAEIADYLCQQLT
jgi:histidyl-tRNA synthetase